MIVKVRVIPNAIENEVVSRIGSVLRVKVAAPAVDEHANAALKDYLAEFFEVPGKRVSILRESSKCHRRSRLVSKGMTRFVLKYVSSHS